MMLGLTTPEDKLEGDGGNPEQSSRVQAVVSFFGPTDLTVTDFPDQSRKILNTFLGGSVEERPDAYRAASPITYVTKNASGASHASLSGLKRSLGAGDAGLPQG